MWSGLDRHPMHQKIYSNAQMTPRLIRQHCEIDDDSRRHLEHAMTKMGLSARAYDRILKVSRTLVDLDQLERIQAHHISEAIQHRRLDRLLGMIGNLGRELTLGDNQCLPFKG